MKSRTSTPVIVDPGREVPLEIDVHPDDVANTAGDGVPVLFAVGLVAERCARTWGYHVTTIERVEGRGGGWLVEARAKGAL